MIGKRIIPALIVFSLVYSCSKDVPVVITVDYGYDYFPFETGRYIIYDVDSIVYNDFAETVDTFKYQVKEYAESFFLDNSNRNTLRIERYKRNYNDTVPYDLIPWTLSDVWQANKTSTSAEKVEENERYVKLIFPVEKNKLWNGNAFNTQGEEKYRYVEINAPKAYGNTLFDSTVAIKQIDTENLIEKKYYAEAYAKNIGMVCKKIIDVESDNIIIGTPIMNRISRGIVYTMTINSYGTE